MQTIEVVIIILLALSALFSILGVIGLFRFKDAYMRMHAGGLVGSFGLIFAAAAAIVFAANEIAGGNSGYISFILHVALALVVVLVTAVISTHVIARSAHRSGQKPIASVDALEEAKKE